MANTFSAVAPHGTWGWHSAIFTSASPGSSPVTWPGLVGGMAISMAFFAKTWGSAAAPAATTWSMFLALAEANTSAGAPG